MYARVLENPLLPRTLMANADETTMRLRQLGHLLLHKEHPLHVDQHFLVDQSRLLDRVSGLAEEPKEIEANQFAAELLMPPGVGRLVSPEDSSSACGDGGR